MGNEEGEGLPGQPPPRSLRTEQPTHTYQRQHRISSGYQLALSKFNFRLHWGDLNWVTYRPERLRNGR
eukprot:832358-Amorphochlora_amoeboformis.AAC.1